MRYGPALAIAALILGYASRPALPAIEGAELVSVYTWTSPDARIGGLSALEMQQDGQGAHALTDKGRLLELNLQRTGTVINGIAILSVTDLPASNPEDPEAPDTEGLAIGPRGAIYVSYERDNLVHRVQPDGAQRGLSDTPLEFKSFGKNAGLEALAIDAAGRLYTLPERPPSKSLGFPVWRWDDAGWTRPFYLPARDGFWVVSAAFGPDARLYLLERRLTFLGFQSRLRRWDMTGDAVANETVLLTTRAGQFGNLEGVSLWRDAAERMRATMVSDNNFWPFMRMQLVEFVLTE